MEPIPRPWTFDDALRSRLTRNLEAFEPRRLPLGDDRAAAVALVLLPVEKEVGFVLTVRASLRRHSGQFALPGGRVDAGESRLEAAMREAREEVGLGLGTEQLIGRLDDFGTRSGYRMSPFVFWQPGPVELVADPREVGSVHRVRVSDVAPPGSAKHFRDKADDRELLSLPVLGTWMFAPTAAILFQLVEIGFFGRPTRVVGLEQPAFAWK